MNDELTETLKGTLKTAARKAPAPTPDLLHRVERRHRTRRRARAGMAAAAVAVTICGSGAVASVLGSAGDPPRPAAQSRPGPLKPIIPGKPVPVERLWPQAVRTVPGELPDGRAYHPIDLLDDDTLLVRTESSLQKTDQLLAYDLRTQRTTRITLVPVPSGSDLFAWNFAIGDGRIAWAVRYKRSGRHVVEIWAAPLAGGNAHRVAATEHDFDEGASVQRLTVGGGKVYWSLAGQSSSRHGVYEAPLSGGTARQIPGTTGFQVLAWPWIGGPGLTRPWQGKPGDVFHRTLLDLRNGQTTKAGLATVKGPWNCGITWCLGYKTLPKQWSGGNVPVAETYLQRRDGTGGRMLRNLEGRHPSPPLEGFLLHERFLPYTPSPGQEELTSWLFYDTQTGEVGRVTVQRDKRGGYPTIGPQPDPAKRIVWVPRGNRYMLIDLAKAR